jgi:hypothetical protein
LAYPFSLFFLAFFLFPSAEALPKNLFGFGNKRRAEPIWTSGAAKSRLGFGPVRFKGERQ